MPIKSGITESAAAVLFVVNKSTLHSRQTRESPVRATALGVQIRVKVSQQRKTKPSLLKSPEEHTFVKRSDNGILESEASQRPLDGTQWAHSRFRLLAWSQDPSLPFENSTLVSGFSFLQNLYLQLPARCLSPAWEPLSESCSPESSQAG